MIEGRIPIKELPSAVQFAINHLQSMILATTDFRGIQITIDHMRDINGSEPTIDFRRY
jgi:hypothetical protein